MKYSIEQPDWHCQEFWDSRIQEKINQLPGCFHQPVGSFPLNFYLLFLIVFCVIFVSIWFQTISWSCPSKGWTVVMFGIAVTWRFGANSSFSYFYFLFYFFFWDCDNLVVWGKALLFQVETGLENPDQARSADRIL